MSDQTAGPALRRKALFFFSTGHLALRELRPVLVHFAATGWDVKLYLGASGPQATLAVQQLQSEGIEAEVLPAGVGYEADTRGEASQSAVQPQTAPSLSLRIRRLLRLLYAHRLAGFWRYLRVARRNLAWARQMLARERPGAVFLNMFHSVGEVDNAVQKAAREMNLPLFCLTNSPYVGERPHRIARANHMKTGMVGSWIRADFDLVNRLFAALFPGWTRRLSNGITAFYWDPMKIAAGAATGLGMHRMWLKPSLDFDKVFVFGEASRDMLLEDKYPADRIVVAGQPLMDAILGAEADSRRRAALKHVHLDGERPFLLVNIEPSVEHSYATEEAHWNNFRAVMRACVGHGVPVVLSLHPLCHTPDYLFAEQEYGVRISLDHSIHELYPYCAVSVSFPCSTNFLALQFDRPLVVYDFFGLVGSDPDSVRFHVLEGMTLARNESELRSQISESLRTARGKPPMGKMPRMTACETIAESALRVLTQAETRK